MKTEFIFVLLFIATTIGVDIQNVPQVQISNGLLQGVYEKSYNGRTFSSFEGIPYARPPVGELRFEAPKEPYNWTGIWIANTKHTCLQTMLETVIGDEDCLYLNVYVPRENPSPTDNLNVIVHIHAGGFSSWSGHAYAGPKFLMDEEVIFITINYRLGPFGFLSTQDEVVPGNNGLKDQVLSLQWIQKNIKYFGGNPSSVTITGASAGGGSVHLHYFSPLSRGLFHRGVSQSGNALDSWLMVRSPWTRTTQLAEKLGCPTETSRELVNCLKSRSGLKIAEDMKSLVTAWPFMFVPVVEPEHDGAFLSQHPYKMLLDKAVYDVPWIVSVVEREGFAAYISMPETLAKVGENFDSLMPHILLYNNDDDHVQKFVTDKVREHYFKGTSTDIIDTTVDVIGDRLFLAGAAVASKLQAKATKSSVYFYNFKYRGEHSFDDMYGSKTKSSGVSHLDDTLYYLHNSAVGEGRFSESDERMKSIFMQWFLSFVETGTPKVEGVNWNPLSDSDLIEYLLFKDPNNILMEVTKDLGASSFWGSLPLKENEIHKRIRDEL